MKYGWILVRIQTARELSVSRYLEMDGCRVLSPRYIGRDNSPHPLFPGYIFVHIREADDYALVKRTPGVISVVRGAQADDEIYECPGWVIWSITSRMDDYGFVDLEKDLGGISEPKEFTPGERLLVKSGLLAGKLVEFIKMDAAGRVAALYSAFERTASVALDRRDVQAV